MRLSPRLTQAVKTQLAVRCGVLRDGAVRFLSAEPLLEDIADNINLDGFRWVIAGGESGGGGEYVWDSTADWRDEFDRRGRRIMDLQWALNLRHK